MSLTAEPSNGGVFRTFHLHNDQSGISFAHDLDDALTAAAADGGGLVHLWIHDVDRDAPHGSDSTAADTATVDSIARQAGFIAHRDLWQLRCVLPAEPSNITTRAFTPADADDLIGVNNRAFSWHPEQSGMTTESLAATMAEPWFDPNGLRLHHHGDDLIGFCWTKVHPADPPHEPVLGEIYVIAVDPSAHGQGLGSPMTRAGLDWLAARNITTGMLYVESDNDAANRVYERIGFTRHRIDRAYHRTVGPSD